MLISTALLLDSIICNSVCTPAKLPCRRVEVGYAVIVYVLWQNCCAAGWWRVKYRLFQNCIPKEKKGSIWINVII
jgi:hypothetical protein